MHRLKELRKYHRLSQQEVAEALHLDQTTYSRLENSNRPLMSDEVISLANLYHISCDEVLGYRAQPYFDRAREILGIILRMLSDQEKQDNFGYVDKNRFGT